MWSGVTSEFVKMFSTIVLGCILFLFALGRYPAKHAQGKAVIADNR